MRMENPIRMLSASAVVPQHQVKLVLAARIVAGDRRDRVMRDPLSVLLAEREDLRFRITVNTPVVEQLASQLVQLLLVVPA
ncbi:hypothetical protein D3C85_1739790 [compost metagenome]